MDSLNNSTAYLKKPLPSFQQKKPNLSSPRITITKQYTEKKPEVKFEPEEQKPYKPFIVFNDVKFNHASKSAGEHLGRIKSLIPKNLK